MHRSFCLFCHVTAQIYYFPRLAAKLKEAQDKKEKIEDDIKTKQDYLDNLQPKLNTILQVKMSQPMTEPTKWLHPAKTHISLGICPVWSVFAVRMKKLWALNYLLSAQWRLWSDWADAQADLSLRWVHKSFCWLCRVAAHIMIGWLSIALHPYLQYFSHIRTMDKWSWLALCNEAPFRLKKNLAARGIQTEDTVIGSREC